ncbi:MAG: winged helix-turn-helix transcriptional regulator, partial [Micrococcales bacterium]|nr:winged helix-turn-helix transcriptional regulator [Micrococcales bacterium]
MGSAVGAVLASPEQATTRADILAMVVAEGPITVLEIAETLGLTPAGVRRHTAVLVEEDLIQDHDALAPPGVRRPGRP